MAIANKNTMLKSVLFMISLSLALAACAETSSGSSTDVAAAKSNTATQQAEVAGNVAGEGMEMPLDGTSVATFDASLALVKQHTNEENYRSLEKAISYLMAFDISVRNDKARLASRLNGMNGYEVVAKYNKDKPTPAKSGPRKAPTDV